MELRYVWTDGTEPDFERFSEEMEAYYNSLVGGEENRKGFIPHNSLAKIHDVVMVYDGKKAVACASFKQYDDISAEIKRVWVSAPYRGNHISKEMMRLLEGRAKEKGFRKVILQTRKACVEALSLYRSLGYRQVENYPPYECLDEAVCYAKSL